jgi:hapalindole-type alkaloid chlorinase
MESASFRTATIDHDDTGAYRDALWAIHVGELDLLIVRGVLEQSACARAVAALEDPGAKLDWTLQEHSDPQRKQFRLLGVSLTPYQSHPQGPTLEHYFAQSAMFRRECRRLFAGGEDFEASVERAFAALAGGRPVVLPPGPGPHDHYTPATIRSLPPGCEIPLHVGNYFLQTPAYRDLATRVDLKDQLSYFIPLQNPEQGGELVVYELEWGTAAPEQTRGGRANYDDSGDPWPGARFAPGVGELLLFNGGRYYHRVSRVGGARHRWTIGGFLSFSPDGASVLYWS